MRLTRLGPLRCLRVDKQACRDFGSFYVENHGVSEEVIREVFRQSKSFFSLGRDDKMSVRADKNNRGYTPMHEQVLDPENQTIHKGDTEVSTHFRSRAGRHPWQSTLASSSCLVARSTIEDKEGESPPSLTNADESTAATI